MPGSLTLYASAGIGIAQAVRWNGTARYIIKQLAFFNQ